MDNSEDSIDAWALTPDGHVRITGTSRANRMAFAVLLLFFRAKRAEYYTLRETTPVEFKIT
jgi:hypothetical protein